MDKRHPSSRQNNGLPTWLLAGFLAIALPRFALPAIILSDADALRIGKKIWQNECNGTVSGLTSWNAGEDFASLGIGHFIWYPEGKRGPFEESFPKFVAFTADHSVKLPDLLRASDPAHCPWKSRTEFLHAQQSAEMKQLRQFLVDTIVLQSQFMVDRLQRSLSKMLAETMPANRAKVQENFQRVSHTAQGCYALVDYVNFKGEGVLHSERYQGQGWGLLQVLETMRPATSDPVTEFSHSAAGVLTRRVHNAPPERHESRWLPGWLNRVNGYSRD